MAAPGAIQPIAIPGCASVTIRISLSPLDASDQGHHIQKFRFDSGVMSVPWFPLQNRSRGVIDNGGGALCPCPDAKERPARFWKGMIVFCGGVVYRERAYFTGITSQKPGKNS
jgi:hypothetical protein